MKKSVINVFKTLICLAVICVCFLAQPKEAKAADPVFVTNETELRSAIEEVPEGETIYICNDIHITSTLIIDRPIVLAGMSTIYVDHTDSPAGSSSYEEKWGVCLKTSNIVIKNITIDGQNLERTRGLVYVSTGVGARLEKVTIQNCISTAAGDNGCAGIYVSRGTDTPDETTIFGCTIKNCISKNGNGGGITINSKNIKILCCKMIENKAAGYGGGIYEPGKTDESEYGGCVIERCVFKNNEAGTSGKGNDVYIGISKTVVKKCVFGKNLSIASASDKTGNYMVCKGTSEGCTFYCDLVFEGYVNLGGNNWDDLTIGYYKGANGEIIAVILTTKENFEYRMEFAAKNSEYKRLFTGKIGEYDVYIMSYSQKLQYIYYCYYNDNDGIMRIIEDKVTNSTDIEDTRDKYDVTPSVSLINVSDESNATQKQATRYGLSMVYRLTDGSFMVVDGGYENETSVKRLYNKLVELNGSSEGIVISAWLLTHAHNDHVGAFVKFQKDYGSSVKCERVIYNFPGDNEFNATTGDPEGSTSYRDKAISAISNWGAKTLIAHTGQTFSFGGAYIEVLYTYEMAKPTNFCNINDTSTVFAVTLGNYRTCILGDISDRGEPYLLQIGKDKLKSDIVTVSHHGYFSRSLSPEVYEAIGARVVLWPASETVYTDSKNVANDTNIWIKGHTASSNIHVAYTTKADKNWSYTMPLATLTAGLGAQLFINPVLGMNIVVDVVGNSSRINKAYVEFCFEREEPIVLTDYVSEDGIYVFPLENFGFHRIMDRFKIKFVGKDISGNIIVQTIVGYKDSNRAGEILYRICKTYPDDYYLSELAMRILMVAEYAPGFCGNHYYVNGALKYKDLYWTHIIHKPDVNDLYFNMTKATTETKILEGGLRVSYGIGLYFDVVAPDLTGLTVSFANGDLDFYDEINIADELTEKSGRVIELGNDIYRVYMEPLPSYLFSFNFDVTLRRNGTKLHYVSYSVNSYCYHKWDINTNLIQNIYNYGLAAENYLLSREYSD